MKRRYWRNVAAACCLFVVVLAAVWFFGLGKTVVLPDDITRRYKPGAAVMVTDLGIEWPWEYQTASERYTMLERNGIAFRSRGRTVDPSLMGEKLGVLDVIGYDSVTEEEHCIPAEIYRIGQISEDHLLAVKMDSEYWVFYRSDHNPPETFGDLWEAFDLMNTLKFEGFSMQGDHAEQKYYRLEDYQPILHALRDAQNAVFLEDMNWRVSDRDYLSFTVTSDALGVYKRVFYVTEDGFIRTNIFDWACLFEVGTKITGQIYDWALEYGVEAEQSPYTNSLSGVVVEITEEELLVDDTKLCTVPWAGMVFRVPMSDLRIKRCVELGRVRVGDAVSVSFTGSIDPMVDNLVAGAYDIRTGTLSTNFWQ